ncbi:hypothetical protein [Oryza sativa Japonica Group]|uniref:Uncharacterized protein n=1 Tax=Oryza sativa subsp. japonica TaxID=39947 RepID=Q5N970_ORYSJ|nr:hypothetical protein [Oryza sativa Japonica Group]
MILRRIMIPPRFNMILLEYHLIPRNYATIIFYVVSDDSYHVSGDTREELGVEVSRHRRLRPCPPPSTLHTEPEPRRRQPHPPPSTVHIGARRQRPRPPSGARHRQPRPSSTPQPAATSSTLELNCRRRRHHHAGSSAVHAPRLSSSPAPSLSPRRSSAVHATMPHAGARLRPRPPCWSSSPAAASSALEVVGAGRVRAAGVSRICAASTVACTLVSEGGGQGAIPLG